MHARCVAAAFPAIGIAWQWYHGNLSPYGRSFVRGVEHPVVAAKGMQRQGPHPDTVRLASSKRSTPLNEQRLYNSSKQLAFSSQRAAT
jgi:hypothetical protein